MEESVPVLIGAVCALVAAYLPSFGLRTGIMLALSLAGGVAWSVWIGETESGYEWALLDAAQAAIAFALIRWLERRRGILLATIRD
jgi:hypothetical protein